MEGFLSVHSIDAPAVQDSIFTATSRVAFMRLEKTAPEMLRVVKSMKLLPALRLTSMTVDVWP